MAAKKETKKKEKKFRCDLCGRLFDCGELAPGRHPGRLLCRDCRAEEKSCGCPDT